MHSLRKQKYILSSRLYFGFWEKYSFLEASSVELIFNMGQSGSIDNKKKNQFEVHDHESEHSGLLIN